MSCAQLTTSDHGHRASASTDLEQLLVFEEGYAMPFIAQYRKDAIGLLSLEQLNRLQRTEGVVRELSSGS